MDISFFQLYLTINTIKNLHNYFTHNKIVNKNKIIKIMKKVTFI
jgi:hypothetical protein